jgi:hypothetical protein
VQHLGQVGLHPGPLPGGQDNDGKFMIGHVDSENLASENYEFSMTSKTEKHLPARMARTVPWPVFSHQINICCRLLQPAGRGNNKAAIVMRS